MATSAISLHAEGVTDAFKQKGALRIWLQMVIRREGISIEELSFVLMSDEALLDYNQKYLHHDDLTDVITFDLSEESSTGIQGEILISYDRVKDNARTFAVSAQHELRRVMVHGLLHLCGHSDKTTAAKQAMRLLEDKYLALL